MADNKSQQAESEATENSLGLYDGFKFHSEFIAELQKRGVNLTSEIAKRDSALAKIVEEITALEKTLGEKESSRDYWDRRVRELQKEAEEKNGSLYGKMHESRQARDQTDSLFFKFVHGIADIIKGDELGTMNQDHLAHFNNEAKTFESQLIDPKPAENELRAIKKTVQEYIDKCAAKTDEKTLAEQAKNYELFTQLLLNQQAVRIATMLEAAAQNADTSLDEMLQHPPIQKLAEGFVGGHLTRETLDMAVEWASIYKDVDELPPEELAFKQFINRRVIPNIGAFEVFSSMVDDFQKTGIKGYPRLELLKQKDISFSGKKAITSKESAAVEAQQLSHTLSAMATKINGALTTSEPMLTRLDKAINANEEHLQGFEKLFVDIEEKIEKLVDEAASKAEEKTDRMKKLDRAIDKNDEIQGQIGLTEAEIKGRNKHLLKEKPRAVRMLNEGLDGAVDGALRGGTIGGGDPHAVSGGGAFGFLRGLRRGWKKKIDPQKIEVTVHQELLEYLRSQQVDVAGHKTEINEISGKITKLLEDKDFEEKVSDRLKIERIKNAYVTRMLLHSGKQNTYLLDQACDACGVESVDKLLAAYKGELGMSLKRFCYGIANTNDMMLILHEANTLSGDLAPHKQALKTFIEDVVKPDVDDFLAAASKVDAIGQSNLLPYGSPFQLTQGIVRDEDDFRYKALMVNEFGMSKVGLQDVRRAFDFYLHRHGNTVFYDTHLNDGKTDNVYPKRIHVEPHVSMVSFIDRTKQAMSRGAEEIPQVSDIFMRICAYEYFLPQKIQTTGANSIFSLNPAAPAAYPMINDTVNRFVEQMSLGPIQRYREVVGDATRLDNVIAQTFVDYFAHLGVRHESHLKIEKTRKELKNSAGSNKYGPMFNLYARQISQDSCENFKLFMEIYRNNLEQELPTMTGDDRALLEEHLAALPDPAKSILQPEIIKPGSRRAGFVAKYEDHTFKNTIDGQLGRR